MKWWTCVVLMCAAALADDEWREVRTAQGPVRGRKHPTEDIYTFYNIPYATAPTGQDKFLILAPLPGPVWSEPFDAVDEKVICPQALIMAELVPKNPVVKENCLIASRDPVEIAKTHARKLNFTNVDDIYALENFYKTASMELLTSDNFFYRTDSIFTFSPCVERDTGDGAFLTESPLSILKSGNYRKLPVLYGFSEMEGLTRIGFFDIWKHKMNEKFSDFLPADLKFESDEEREEVASKIKKFYFGEKPVGNDNILKYVDFFSDVMFAYHMLWPVKLHVERGGWQQSNIFVRIFLCG
uniref:Carboxylesterase type B domain-containing protein n=1 Tax=Heliothis virescens TaxID=7102 RepID=A0A2A4J4W2_HELVI